MQQTTKAQKLFARTRTGPPRPTIGVEEARAISNRVLICDAMLRRLEGRENAHVYPTNPYLQKNKDPMDIYHSLRTAKPLVPVDAAYHQHVIAYRAWRADWIRIINKHKPTRIERRAARRVLATKEH